MYEMNSSSMGPVSQGSTRFCCLSVPDFSKANCSTASIFSGVDGCGGDGSEP